MHFIHKQRGHSPETHRLWMERKQILKLEKTRIVGKGKDNERFTPGVSPLPTGPKKNRGNEHPDLQPVFFYCETLGTTPLRKYQQNHHESWLSHNLSDNERQVSHVKPQKCPVNASKKFRKHETVKLIRLKQTVKANTMETDNKERTTETIKKAEREFALDFLY